MGLLSAIGIGALYVIGFTAAGPAGGSLAAWIQSAVYGGAIVSGSWFAICQSIAMSPLTP